MRNVVLLGSTGSIGTSTIKVVEDLPDHLRLLGLAAGHNIARLMEQTRRHKPEAISVADATKVENLKASLGPLVEVHAGSEGLLRLATLPGADIVLIAIVGTAGLQPALAAIRAGKDIAVASKEILVMAGETVMSEARKHGVRVLAVDSEHSFSMSRRQTGRFGAQLVAHGFRWAFSDHTQGGVFENHASTCTEASFLGHGPQDHH
jgi:1-deoxy-D-xylulose-5-phosphate reductoisomerase